MAVQPCPGPSYPLQWFRFRAPAALGAVLDSTVFLEESEGGLLPQSLYGGKGHSFDKGRLPTAAAAGRGHACSCAACSTAAAAAAVRARRGFAVWLVWMCKVWFSSCSGSESLPLRLQQSEFRGDQSPRYLSPIFHRYPRHLGGVFYKKLKNVSCEYDRV